MLKGPAYAYLSHLDKMRNSRAGTKALHAHYEFELATSETKAQAYEAIKNVPYSDEKQKWTFKMYVLVHQKAIIFQKKMANLCHQQNKFET